MFDIKYVLIWMLQEDKNTMKIEQYRKKYNFIAVTEITESSDTSSMYARHTLFVDLPTYLAKIQ